MKILLVEDEPKMNAYLKKGLEEEGFQVHAVSNGLEGYDLALKENFDLLVLDVMLPEKDGWSIMQDLRKNNKDNLVLFLTAKDSLEDRVRGLELGGDGYLVKPFAFSELLANVRTLLRRSPQRTSDVLQIGDLQIHTSKRLALRAGQKLDLTPKEFALLMLLARRRGEILSRTTISEEVWDIHYDTESNVVDVHIRRLRAKVDDPFEKKLIKTHRGMGYGLDADEQN